MNKVRIPWCTITLILVLILSLFVGCTKNHFEVENRIYPKILNVSGDEISIEYYLGKLLVLDTIEVTNTAHAIYIQQHINEIMMQLKIIYNDSDPL